jgi:AbrB family looped-hinge helix DNA binding protein
MTRKPLSTEAEPEMAAGFSTLDEKGRVSLPKAVRSALGVQPGSALAYVVLDHSVLFIPQDEHLLRLQQQASEALAAAGLTVQDLLDRLPRARDEVVREAYSPDFLARLKALRESLQSAERAEQDA